MKNEYKLKSSERADFMKVPGIGTVELSNNEAIVFMDDDLATELIEDGFLLTEIKQKKAPKKERAKKGKGV